MIRLIHIDKIEDDDAAQITQTQLTCDRLRRFEVRLENRLVKITHADETTGIHVNCRHGFGLIKDQIAARFKIHPPRQGALNLVFHTVEIKQRPVVVVVLQQGDDTRHIQTGKLLQLLEGFARINQDAFRFGIREIAQHALRQREILINQRRYGRRGDLLLDITPQLTQIADVILQRRIVSSFGDGAQDEAASFIVGYQTGQAFA